MSADPRFEPAATNLDDVPFAEPAPVKRCLTCYYVLDHLPSSQCPECGRPFDPENPYTYTVRPPFVWWRYWVPGFLLAAGLGLACYALILPGGGFGWATTVAVPVMIGGVVGYSVRLGKGPAVAIAVLTFLACLLGLIFAGFAGVFCALVLLGMALVPLGLSVLAGVVLRFLLKRSGWSHRHWLPVLVMFLVPPAVAGIESLLLPRPPAEAVRTSRVIDAPPADAWDAVMFYEEVEHDPPWLLWVGLRRPLYTSGRVDRVGARKTCVYSRGHLTKEVTAIRPEQSLEFAVVEQRMFEDYSVRLKGGSFRFEAVDATRTRVTLTTEYEPLLRPRWAWRPVEGHVVHLLHGHVLEGMAREAQRQRGQAGGAVAVAEEESP